MLTLGNPAHTLIYSLPSGMIAVTELHPTKVYPTRTYYTVAEFMAAIAPGAGDDTLALAVPGQLAA